MFCGGINIDIFSNVLILIPVKILPVELFDAFLVKYLLVKHINKYSEEISIKLGLMENTDSFISQPIGDSCIK